MLTDLAWHQNPVSSRAPGTLWIDWKGDTDTADNTWYGYMFSAIHSTKSSTKNLKGRETWNRAEVAVIIERWREVLFLWWDDYTVSLLGWCGLRNKNLLASFLLGHSILSQRWEFTCYVIHSHFIISLLSHELIPRKQEKKSRTKIPVPSPWKRHKVQAYSFHWDFRNNSMLKGSDFSLSCVMAHETRSVSSFCCVGLCPLGSWLGSMLHGLCRRHALEQWHITVLAPGTYSVEDNFSMNQRLGGWFLDD